MTRLLLLAAATVVGGAFAAPQGTSSASSASASSSASSSGTPTSASTAIPSPTADLNSQLPSQAPLPPKQAWCPSNIFCAGQLLQTINIAQLYTDPKTIVDKPTSKSSDAVLSNFFNYFNNSQGQPVTYGGVSNFVQTNFKGEGLELESITTSNATTEPKFLSTIPNPLNRAWVKIVNSYWGSLIRQTDPSTLCPNNASGCESSLIPLNHTFVVPGGRFREQYYWDTFWIIQGLLKSELYDVALSNLLNFMDELDQFGFIPNGGRIYYLNRSQPPVFIHMLSEYVKATKDTSILAKALPLAEKELEWWTKNRTISVTSPYTNKTYQVSHYAVNNTAPRPESYLKDYITANGELGGEQTGFTEEQKEALYSELASGAETGWDYSSRWTKDPFATIGNVTNQEPLLRGLQVRATIPVDLNSILYGAYVRLADLYDLSNSGKSANKKSLAHVTYANSHRQAAADRKAAILDLMWDPAKLAFYDFNLNTNARSGFFSAAAFYPMWNVIWPSQVYNDEGMAQAMFASVGLVLGAYNGTFPATFVTTGAQWDAPNTWPPHQYIVLEALNNVPKNLSNQAYPTLSSTKTSFSLIPNGQLGLEQSQLPVQNLGSGGNAQGDINYHNGTWSNGGALPTNGTEKWNKALLRGLANRYFTSVFCSWYSTGGSIPGMLNQLSPAELNASNSDPSSTGHMYEKFNLLDLDAAGSGGEYQVQAGFGWTNGALLWVAANFGPILEQANCPAISVTQTAATKKRSWYGKRDQEEVMYEGRRLRRSDGRYLVEVTREETDPRRKA